MLIPVVNLSIMTTSISLVMVLYMFIYAICVPCAVENTVLEETTFYTKPGERIHTLHIWLMILFSSFKCSSGWTVHPSCRMCFAVLFHCDHSPGDLSHPLSCAGFGVGPCGLITGISREWFGCSPTAALTSIWGGIFFSITPVVPTVPSALLDTLRHIWAAHPATMVTEEFY